MLNDLKIDNDKLLFENKKGYYSFDLEAIDTIDYRGFSISFKFYNGKICVVNYEDRDSLEKDFEKLSQLLSIRENFFQRYENIIINLANIVDISSDEEGDIFKCYYLIVKYENIERKIAVPDWVDLQSIKRSVSEALKDFKSSKTIQEL